MQKPTGDLGVLVSETDLTGWDPKSVEVVKKYGLSRMRLDSLTHAYVSPEVIERQYLIHVAGDVSSKAFDKAPAPFDEIKEARDIFALVDDLYTRKGLHSNSYVHQMLDRLNVSVSLGP